LGVTPSAWFSTRRVLQLQTASSIASFIGSEGFEIRSNAFLNTSAQEIYVTSAPATLYGTSGGQHRFYTAPSGTAGNAISFTQAMTLDASGNLSVGTTTAYGKISAVSTANQFYALGQSNTATAEMLFQSNASDSTQPRGQVSVIGSSSSTNYQALKAGYMTIYSAYADIALNADTSKTIQFWTGANERARIDSSGNFGIGTSSPSEKLDVYVNSTSNISAKVGNTSGSIQLLQSNGIAYLYTAANQPIAFSTNNTERARIDSSGNLLIGTTTSNGIFTGSEVNNGCVIEGAGGAFARQRNNDAPVYLSKASGFANGNMIIFYVAGSAVGSISVTGSATSYNTSSDYRLKQDIQPMTGALAFVRNQRPVTYRWKADGSEGEGYIAHWLQEDGAGNCVTGTKDAVDAEGKPVYQGIDTSFMVPKLNAALNELADMFDALKAEFDAYKASHP
jgi:hypothetical protein